MAGKIIADTLEHSTAGSVDTQYVVNGSAKAYAHYDQVTTSLLYATHLIAVALQMMEQDKQQQITLQAYLILIM